MHIASDWLKLAEVLRITGSTAYLLCTDQM